MEKLRIALAGNTMAGYPQGGGHWSVRLQYMRGLRDLGHDLLWIELLPRRANSDAARNRRLIGLFLARWQKFGFGDSVVVLEHASGERPDLDQVNVHGRSREALAKTFRETDLLLNFHCSMKPPLLSRFSRKVLLDLDPAIIQIAVAEYGRDDWIGHHDIFFSVGLNLHGSNCPVPLLGKVWHPFVPPIHLPSWIANEVPPPDAAFTSITQWGWKGHMELNGQILNASKRLAYMRYCEVPKSISVPVELALNLPLRDKTSDRADLLRNGWRLVDPHRIGRTVKAYQSYIRASKGEFGCAKPIHSQLQTGWFSDRSAAFLASGRPVVVEDTGFGCTLPVGEGILAFNSVESARAALEEANADHASHARAALELASALFDSDKVLPAMLERCA